MDQKAAFEEAWGPSGTKRAHLIFTGNSREYFSIWIVNVLLTVVTLGVYLAWAKVRTRRYFHWNTYLEGHHFDYLAEPRAILKGHIILFGGLALSWLLKEYLSAAGATASLALYLLIPWLIYKAHRFRARNTAYRGVRFRFLGSAGRAYLVYGLHPAVFIAASAIVTAVLYRPSGEPLDAPRIWWPMLFSAILALAAGAVYPYWSYLLRKYSFSNLAFGTSGAVFRSNPGFFYKTYLKASLLALVLIFPAILGLTLFAGLLFATGGPAAGAGFGVAVLPILAVVAFYALFSQYLFAVVTNHCWTNLRIGGLGFTATMNPWRLVWIRLTNILAVIISLGLLTPWAAVRRYEYVASCFTVTGVEGMESFTAAADEDVSATGDAAADYFDLDIGW